MILVDSADFQQVAKTNSYGENDHFVTQEKTFICKFLLFYVAMAAALTVILNLFII